MQSARRHPGADFGAQLVDQPQALPGFDVPEGPAIAGARALRHRADSLRLVTRLPDGQIRSYSDYPLSSLPFKKIPFRARPKSNPYFELSRPTEGRFAIVTDVGTGCGGREAARKTNAHASRTAKSCGPDAPTLASSFADQSARRRWQTSPVTGESAKETVKTIARGMPGESGVTVVTMLVCFFYFAREAAGALGTRHSLRPPVFEGGSFINSGGLRRGI